MDCPICNSVKLAVTERQGIEIDYCPQCRGIWLDRGELDKIIDRAPGMPAGAGRDSRAPYYESRPDAEYGYRDTHRDGHYRKRKREGFLSELFDFD